MQNGHPNVTYLKLGGGAATNIPAPHSILVPMQFSASDSVSLNYAASVSSPGTLVILLHVVREEDGALWSAVPTELVRRSMRSTAELFLEGRRVETVVAAGEPYAEIVNQAQAYEAELIIMTPERCRGLLALFRRNSAARVARETLCPVIFLNSYGSAAGLDQQTSSRNDARTRARVFC